MSIFYSNLPQTNKQTNKLKTRGYSLPNLFLVMPETKSRALCMLSKYFTMELCPPLGAVTQIFFRNILRPGNSSLSNFLMFLYLITLEIPHLQNLVRVWIHAHTHLHEGKNKQCQVQFLVGEHTAQEKLQGKKGFKVTVCWWHVEFWPSGVPCTTSPKSLVCSLSYNPKGLEPEEREYQTWGGGESKPFSLV